MKRLVELGGMHVRVIVQPGGMSDNAALQAWNADHLRYRWRDAQRLLTAVAEGRLAPQEWYDAMDGLLLEGHANASWIGRAFGLDLTDAPTEDDLLLGRAMRDADGDHLLNFLDDLENGRYLNDEGEFMLKSAQSRARLYVGKMRGTTGQAMVDALGDEALHTWRLSAIEEHCTECPELAQIFVKVPRSELWTTPGGGRTPCLGNCLCFLESESVAGDVITGPQSVTLTYENEDFNEQAA